MTDEEILRLFARRDERAVEEVKSAYGRLMRSVAYNILQNREDAEECENEACLRAWNSIPPAMPQKLCAYLCSISRRLAIDRWDSAHSTKRGAAVALEELETVLSSTFRADDRFSERQLAESLNSFLSKQDYNTRVIFVRRFWLGQSTAEIAKDLHASGSMVKSRLSRTMKRLKEYLKKEGYDL